MHFLDQALNRDPYFEVALDIPIKVLTYCSQERSGILSIAKIPKQHRSRIEGKKVELAHLVFDAKNNIVSTRGWMIDTTQLPDQDIAGLYLLAAVSFDPAALAVAVPAVS